MTREKRVTGARLSRQLATLNLQQANRLCRRCPEAKELLSDKMALLAHQSHEASQYVKCGLFAAPTADFDSAAVLRTAREMQQLMQEIRKARALPRRGA